ncbi:MAG: hypothetical protein U5R31_09670 [Acidimicrobiia bacterium]|nr:hypothetical protein [Acidimicrobiia bacterium]
MPGHPGRRVPCPTLLALFVVALWPLAACSSDGGDVGASATTEKATTSGPPPTSTTTTATGPPVDPSALEADALADLVCRSAGSQELGRVQDPDLIEISGLVASAKNADVLWAHNDSGGEATVHALGTDGSDQGSWTLAGAEARDWEDLAGWYDPASDRHWLHVADIGDNGQQRESVTVHRFEEPVVDGGGGSTVTAREVELTYPDGPHDAEVFFVDPSSGDWYVLTKGWGTGISQVFRTPAPTGATAVLEPAGTVDLRDHGSYATGGERQRDQWWCAPTTRSSSGRSWRHRRRPSTESRAWGPPPRSPRARPSPSPPTAPATTRSARARTPRSTGTVSLRRERGPLPTSESGVALWRRSASSAAEPLRRFSAGLRPRTPGGLTVRSVRARCRGSALAPPVGSPFGLFVARCRGGSAPAPDQLALSRRFGQQRRGTTR